MDFGSWVGDGFIVLSPVGVKVYNRSSFDRESRHIIVGLGIISGSAWWEYSSVGTWEVCQLHFKMHHWMKSASGCCSTPI